MSTDFQAQIEAISESQFAAAYSRFMREQDATDMRNDLAEAAWLDIVEENVLTICQEQDQAAEYVADHIGDLCIAAGADHAEVTAQVMAMEWGDFMRQADGFVQPALIAITERMAAAHAEHLAQKDWAISRKGVLFHTSRTYAKKFLSAA